MAGNFGLWAVFATCCSGAILFPLGWLLVSINRGRDTKVQLTQEQMIGAMNPIENELNSNPEILTTDQLYKLVRGEVPEMEQQQSDVPSPFSDADTRVKSQPKKKRAVQSTKPAHTLTRTHQLMSLGRTGTNLNFEFQR